MADSKSHRQNTQLSIQQVTQFAALTRAMNQLQQATSVDEVVDIRNQAEAIRKYAKISKQWHAVMNHAAEVKLRCERKIGDFLIESGVSRGGDQKSNGRSRPGLEDLGVSRNQSSRCQKLARLSLERFERYISESKAADFREISTAAALRLEAAPRPPKPPADDGNRDDGPNRKADFGAQLDGEEIEQMRFNMREAREHLHRMASLLEELCRTGATALEKANQRALCRYIKEMDNLLDC